MEPVNIHLPPELEQYEGDIRFFVDLMIRKLHTNRHKGFAEGQTIHQLSVRLDAERSELEEAISTEGQFDVALECADVANFAFLLALKALRMDKAAFEEQRQNGGA